MNAIAYAYVRIDGQLELSSCRVGILQGPRAVPVVQFYVRAGMQRHPIWALRRLAAVVYGYSQVAKRAGEPIELSISGNLVSGQDIVCVVAASIQWHTSSRIREEAEALIASLVASESLWPKNDLRMPVSDGLSA